MRLIDDAGHLGMHLISREEAESLALGLAYALAMDIVTLPPELERFAAEAVAAGRHRDVAAVVVAGVSLLQRTEAARAEFDASLEEAEAESERLGFLTADEVHAEMSGI